ncbi:MAG TPA: hypothetical protein VF546_01665 [Pyrinomonadaceae bacterium]|jgi:hypothetical protein
MLRTLHKIASYLIIALGGAHMLFTLHDYDSFDLDALWFFGAGVAIVFAGFINVILLGAAGRERTARVLAVITNIFCLVMFAAALALLRQPQVFVGILLFAVATTGVLLPARGRP